MMKEIFTILTVLLATCVLVQSRPRYIGCLDSNECGSMACCVVGDGLYSVPHCMPFRTSGEQCLVESYFPINRTSRYPDGAVVQMTNVYKSFCPCEAGLICGDGGFGVGKLSCYDPSLLDDINSISNSVYHH